MPAKDLGTKHSCSKCGTKFYDLKKADPACPKCGSDPRAAPARPSPAAERRRAAKEPVEDVADSVEEADLEGEVPEEDAEEPEEAKTDDE
ncbi:MAG TPA: FYDLN acid domain-containing protein [Anaeromyxobacteraceae bacterium]